ncbi:hypothetical protein BD289DRAFT_22911 [Coniella lustricola]|uniref:Uncharacterized protein n=1 Tax=Coniella lustricola TaxID=2025994 RepID=A0A2T3A3G5_9PEZI|nr:hypothetical protein BD289DRAFT_22911 [Coniella lustricola]
MPTCFNLASRSPAAGIKSKSRPRQQPVSLQKSCTYIEIMRSQLLSLFPWTATTNHCSDVWTSWGMCEQCPSSWGFGAHSIMQWQQARRSYPVVDCLPAPRVQVVMPNGDAADIGRRRLVMSAFVCHRLVWSTERDLCCMRINEKSTIRKERSRVGGQANLGRQRQRAMWCSRNARVCNGRLLSIPWPYRLRL